MLWQTRLRLFRRKRVRLRGRTLFLRREFSCLGPLPVCFRFAMNRLGCALAVADLPVELEPRLRLFLSRHHSGVMTPKAFRAAKAG